MSCEILSPAGSPEALRAAVANGADAVYFGTGIFNARRGAKNFTYDDLRDAVAFCRLRGVKTYVTFNILMTDRELTDAIKEIELYTKVGVDALIVQDLGAARLIREVSPKLPIHASTQMSIHDLDGAITASKLGFERVVLARELPREDIAYICKNSPIGVEIFLHGALCMCYSGQCYMSGVIGGRSGNRGLCAQPCRLDYNGGHPLSLKDLSLAEHLTELESMGVESLKIEGRMKRPEYVAIVTGIYAGALKEKRNPTAEEIDRMRKIFSRSGFTDGYYMNKKGSSMFGTRTVDDDKLDELLMQARQSYRTEPNMIPLEMDFRAVKGEKTTLKCTDDLGNSSISYSDEPQLGITRSTSENEVRENLSKLGGTPFVSSEQRITLDDGLMIPKSVINSLRRDAVEQISTLRTRLPEREIKEYIPRERVKNRKVAPGMNIEIRALSQLSEKLLDRKPELIYIPLMEAAKAPEMIRGIRETKVAFVIPRVITLRNRQETENALKALRSTGVDTVLTGNIGHARMAKEAGYRVKGDFGLNVFNSVSLETLRELGIESATLSFELSRSQLRDISKTIDTELIVYGRLPLMIFENCVISAGKCNKNCEHEFTLTDRTGAKFPVLRADGCRNEVFNSKRLYLADTPELYNEIGLSAVRLKFTTETARECVDIIDAYNGNNTEKPSDFTRGLYKRGVQ